MSTDKKNLRYIAKQKMTKSENVWELKVVFTGLQQKKSVASPAALPQWMTTIMMKTTLKTRSRPFNPL
ncbi:hypothetical protein ACISGY_15145 [Escherichia coli]